LHGRGADETDLHSLYRKLLCHARQPREQGERRNRWNR
jgi:hypothetical protein